MDSQQRAPARPLGSTPTYHRPEVVERIVAGAEAAPVTVIFGPAGIGRTSMLADLNDAWAASGRAVLSLRLSPPERARDLHFASRLVGALCARLGRSIAPTPGLAHPATLLVRILEELPNLIVLIDDGQWLDGQSMAVLARVTPELPRLGVRCVCAIRTPVGPEFPSSPVLDRLRNTGLARALTLRPLSTTQVEALAASVLRAHPRGDLARCLARISRGVPAAVLSGIDGYRRSGSLRVVGPYAFLIDDACAPLLRDDDSMLGPIHTLPEPAWSVAKAVAVLGPLGDAVPRLASSALGLRTSDVTAAMLGLVRLGVLRAHSTGRLAFVVPLTAIILRSCLGPYERRRLAQVAVEALRTGSAACADPSYLPDRLVDIGGLGDDAGTGTELLDRGTACAASGGSAARRWLSAAAELTSDRGVRAVALMRHAEACSLHGDHLGALRSVSRLLAEQGQELSAVDLARAEMVNVAALRGVRDWAAIERIATGRRGRSGRAEAGVVTRVAALCLLDRWPAAARLLATSDPTRLEGAESHYADELRFRLATIMGTPDRAIISSREPPPGLPEQTRTRLAADVRLMAMVGDVAEAHGRLSRHSVAASDLPRPDQALLSWRRGQWDDALDQAWASIAADVVVVHQPGDAALYRAAAEVLVGRGWLVRAKTLLDSAREERLVLPHLLAPITAEIAGMVGTSAEAEVIVASALDHAASGSIVAGTDELWLLHTELAAQRGDRAAARRGVAEAARVADALGTGLSTLHHHVASLIANRDAAAGRSAVRVARMLDQPFALARTLERVVAWGEPRPTMLRESYDLLGSLDALLHRSRLRARMREHGVAIPGRTATLAENERLLALLVAQGLPNRQLAAVLHVSEKSVESRLTRIFSRTGYRSKVELAAAVLAGKIA